MFSKAGDVKRIVMGLDKQKMTPCGFCFVVYYTRADTEDCVKYLNGTVLDARPIRADFDWGFQDGRQFGRGRSGGQVRDEYRMDYDAGRGGYGTILQQELGRAAGAGASNPQQELMDLYSGEVRRGRQEGPRGGCSASTELEGAPGGAGGRVRGLPGFSPQPHTADLLRAPLPPCAAQMVLGGMGGYTRQDGDAGQRRFRDDSDDEDR